jgi:Zn-finger nucleic acid-binding protein
MFSPMSGGPYREGGAGLSCPACQVVLLTDGSWRLTCVKGCGAWWNKGGLERSIDWGVVEAAEPYRLFGYVAPELACPDCSQTMTTSLRAKILFAHCDDHGLWLPREGRAAFEELGGWAKLLAVRARR